jgi:hypothetical protein
VTVDELYAHLCEEGYGTLVRRYPGGISLLDFDIERDGALIRICEKERGQIVYIYLETFDEAAACSFYLDRVSSQFHHLIGVPDADQVVQLQALLDAAGIASKRYDLPESLGLAETRYRIAVMGADLGRSQKLLGL